jgi:hypothetical protein
MRVRVGRLRTPAKALRDDDDRRIVGHALSVASGGRRSEGRTALDAIGLAAAPREAVTWRVCVVAYVSDAVSLRCESLKFRVA